LRARWAVGFIALAIAAGAACSSSSKESAATASTTTAPAAPTTVAEPLRVLVTNDDGVAAPGIDALVEGLRALPDTSVTVVAPATNQSGKGSAVTTGTLTARDAKTKSGFTAKAVVGTPADTIVWAIDDHGISQRPHVVLSGINQGQNLGTLVDVSGTVGAARAAAQRGIPALAASQGLGDSPDYPSGVRAALTWLAAHRAELLARDTASKAPATVTNLNIPTCPSGRPRAAVVVPTANNADAFGTVNCVAPYAAPKTDIDAFEHGYVAQTDNLPLTNAGG
jgi:5'-nucleotidase